MSHPVSLAECEADLREGRSIAIVHPSLVPWANANLPVEAEVHVSAYVNPPGCFIIAKPPPLEERWPEPAPPAWCPV